MKTVIVILLACTLATAAAAATTQYGVSDAQFMAMMRRFFQLFFGFGGHGDGSGGVNGGSGGSGGGTSGVGGGSGGVGSGSGGAGGGTVPPSVHPTVPSSTGGGGGGVGGAGAAVTKPPCTGDLVCMASALCEEPEPGFYCANSNEICCDD